MVWLEAEVFLRVPWNVKLNLFAAARALTLHPQSHPMAETHLPFCVPGLELIFELRNGAAQGEVDSDSTQKTLVRVSRFRGRDRRREVSLARLNYARDDLAGAVARDLDELPLWAADDRVVRTWGQD